MVAVSLAVHRGESFEERGKEKKTQITILLALLNFREKKAIGWDISIAKDFR